MPLTTTNAPPTDPNLLNRNIVRKPRLVDVGAPEPVPKPRLVDVGKPEPVTVPRLTDVGKPKSQSVEELVRQIDGDQNFIPSDEQLNEYFAYNDEQPFDYKKTWDAGVNAVGTALGDITKAVGAAIVDPEFRFNPVKQVATFAEGAARGTWDLSILGRMMTDKFEEVVAEPSKRERTLYLVDRHNEEHPDKEISFLDVFYHGKRDFANPSDYKRYISDYEEKLLDNRRDRWRTMRWITNTRNLAREGKKTIIGEFLGEDVDKALLPYIKQEVAEGSSYFLDPTLPVGLLSAPAKATAKPLVTRIPGLTNVQLLERGLIAPTVEFTGRTLKNTGKKVDEIISNLGAKVEENTDLVKAAQPIMTGASAAAGAYVAPESVGMLGGAVAGAVGGKYGVPQVGKLKAIPKAITIAGEGVEAIGRSMGKPEMLESTLQQAARIAESEPARKLLKGAARLDPAISLVDNLVTGAIEGSKAGGILASPSGDEEFIGGAMGTGAALGGGGGVVGGIAGEKYRTKKQAENTVTEWFNSKTEAEQKSIQNLKLTPVEAANVATAEMLGRGIIGKDKISDINFIYLSQPEFIKKIHPELLVDGELPKVLPPGTRGAMSSPDGTPTVYVNTGHTGPRSVFHEMMHAMLKFDEMGDNRVELRSQLFDQKAEDGTVLKRGMFSEDDIDVFFDQYLSRLPEEMRGAWEEQFKVYKDDFEEFTNPDGTKELKRVIDKEATRANEQKYVMEEVEAESFANFVKDSGPTFLRQSRSIRQQLADRFLLQDNLKKTRVLRSVLEKWGVPFGADGNPTGVFWKDGKPISNNREINKVMRDFVRAKDSVTRRMMEDEGGDKPSLSIGSPRAAEGRKKVEAALKSADGKLLVEHFKTNDIFDRKPNGDIKYDALTGMPILLAERQIKKLQAKRLEKIQAALEEVGIDGGGMMPKKNKDGSISWSGIPTDAQVAKILEIPNDIIPPGMKDSVTDIVEKMRLPGQSIIMDYNPAIGKSGRYSSNLSSGLRVAVPLGFHVSKSGNFYTTTLDLGAVQLKLSDWGNPDGKTHKNLEMWDGDAKRFEQDMYKYLENHKADRPGETGLAENASTAEAKKNIINDFFGVAQKDANPITDARKATKRSGKARRVENLIRSRLFNRMNRIEKNRLTKYGAGTPLPMKTQADAYKKWKENYMPGDEVKYMPGEALTPGETGVQSPADGQRTPQTDLRSSRFRVDSPTGGAGFHAAISDAAQRHKFGAAVEVKQSEFYLDPETKLFLEPDESAGLAITPGRDLVSVFKKPESQANVREILAEAAPYASTLDAFDVGGFLPNLYAENGFRPAARVPWNAEYAPPNWPKEMGEPDVVLMVRDPENVLGLPETDYNQARDQVPLFNDYDAAMAVQHAARAKVDEVGVSDAKYMPAMVQDDVHAQTKDRPKIGVNINDSQLPFSQWIVHGRQNEDGTVQRKTIETRPNPRNNALVGLSKTGERFAIISTFGRKNKQAEIIGTAKAGKPIIYDTLEKFRADQDKHMVEPGSDFDWDGFKVGYPIEDVKSLKSPVLVPSDVRGIKTRDLGDVRYMPGGEPVTHRGREVADWSPEDFADFGKQFGVDNFGPQSKIMPVADQDGKSVNLPGGLDGEFTFYDLLWLKANPIDPSTLSKSLTSKLQQKLVRSVTPEPGDRVEVFNRFLFGMLSPNQPLTPNEFEFAAMRVRSPKDIDKLASFIDWEPGAKVDRVHRKETEKKMTEFYETQAGGAGGMGLKGSADYTNLAEFAKLYKKDPDFFTKQPEESWDQFVEKVMTQTRGLSAKVASFSTVWQDPAHAAISAIDRHMARNFLPKLFPTKKARQQFERSVVKRWNSLVDARRKLDSKYQKTVTQYDRTKKANRSPKLIADYDKYKTELKKLPKAPKSELKKVRNMDEVFRVQGGDAAFMDRVMSILSSNERKFETRGERNPMVPDYLHDVDWINRPDKASVIGDAYRQALAENDRRAQQSGLHLFASQWHLWDRIRRRLEPHEVMFPGLHKIPGMNREQLVKAMNVHKKAGYWSSTKEAYREPTTGEIEMRMKPTRPMPGGPASAAYFMPAIPEARTSTAPPITPEATQFILDRVARFTPQEMDSRKDRAKEILKKFIEQ
jgi:hypothetical protein